MDDLTSFNSCCKLNQVETTVACAVEILQRLPCNETREAIIYFPLRAEVGEKTSWSWKCAEDKKHMVTYNVRFQDIRRGRKLY